MSTQASTSGLDLVRSRTLTVDGLEARFPLQPGERDLVAIGESVVRGAALAERLRDGHTEVAPGPSGRNGIPGAWWQGPMARRPRARRMVQGELLFRSGGQWRIAAGDPAEPLEAPFGGTITDVRPGIEIRLRTESRALLAADVLGGPTSGRLQLLAGRDGHVRAAEIDVAGAGAVLVVGSSIDAEAITRARAVGVRGIVVAALGVKERREVAASELRARAGVHGLPPFAVLVLDGAIARPIATPIMAILEAIEGRTVAIVSKPAGLVFDATDLDMPAVDAELVRITAGPLAGLEGTWGGPAGPYRFAGGVVLEAGWVRMGSRDPVAVPLGDLERFA